MVDWKKWQVRCPDARYTCMVQIRVITTRMLRTITEPRMYVKE